MKAQTSGRSKHSCCEGSEPAAIEIGEQIMVLPVDFRAHLLDTQRAEVRQQLRYQSAADASVLVIGINTDRVDDRSGFDTAKFAEINPRHHEPDRHTVEFGHQRDADVRFGQCVGQLALEIFGPIAAGNPPIDRHQRMQIAFGHRTHRYPVARERPVICSSLSAVVDLGRLPHMLRDGDASASRHSGHSLSCRHSSSIDSASGVITERSSTKRGASPKPDASKNRSKT